MTYLVDSDQVIDYLNGNEHAIRLLEALGRDGIAISLITVAEVYEGIYFGRDPETAEANFRRFLDLVDVLPLDEDVMRRFAFLRGTLRQQERYRDRERHKEFDLLIAATALHHGLIVVTRNVRDFEQVPGIQTYQGQRAPDDDL